MNDEDRCRVYLRGDQDPLAPLMSPLEVLAAIADVEAANLGGFVRLETPLGDSYVRPDAIAAVIPFVEAGIEEEDF